MIHEEKTASRRQGSCYIDAYVKFSGSRVGHRLGLEANTVSQARTCAQPALYPVLYSYLILCVFPSLPRSSPCGYLPPWLDEMECERMAIRCGKLDIANHFGQPFEFWIVWNHANISHGMLLLTGSQQYSFSLRLYRKHSLKVNQFFLFLSLQNVPMNRFPFTGVSTHAIINSNPFSTLR